MGHERDEQIGPFIVFLGSPGAERAMPNRTAIALVITVILVVSLAGGWYVLGQSSNQPPPRQEIRIGRYEAEFSMLLHVAETQKFFDHENLDVEFMDYQVSAVAIGALLSGEVDVVTASDFAFVSYAFNSSDLRILASIATVDAIEIVARSDKEIAQPWQLIGKSVGVVPDSAAEFYLGRFLELNHLSLDDIKVVYLGPDEIVAQLTSGEVDAACVRQPYAYKIESALGTNAVTWSAQGGQDFFVLLISRNEWISAHSSAIERLLSAILQAEQFAGSNVDKIQTLMMERFGYTESYVNSILPRLALTVTLPQALLVVMEDEARWSIESRLTDRKEVPNYLNFIYFDGLMAVKPDAVTIFQ
jgi:ABC-type nitrate/sulfonate/bicarbonate transport system substrate-binding protein